MNQNDQWHKVVQNKDLNLLSELLSDGVVFYSPILYKPQHGKPLTQMYLKGAMHVLLNGSFQYVNEVINNNCSVLEFTTTIDQIEVNGVDMITWDEKGQITEFKVMLRPYSAIQKVKEKMWEALNLINQ